MKSKMKKPETKLERAVARWLKEAGQNYADGPTGAYRDLAYGGCQSGVVGQMVYYRDTVPFYRRHCHEINDLLAALLNDVGSSVDELIRGWDTDDPLALDETNQNLLAWFGFEEAARRLMEAN